MFGINGLFWCLGAKNACSHGGRVKKQNYEKWFLSFFIQRHKYILNSTLKYTKISEIRQKSEIE